MTILTFSLLLGLGAGVTGFVGALTGLGGGVVLVPLLTLGVFAPFFRSSLICFCSWW